MNRLKQKEIKDFRMELWHEQSHTCPLCDRQIEKEDAVLDHCHKTGHIRRVLHRSCNSSEGRVMKWAYSSKSYDPLYFLNNLIKYHNLDFTNMPLHPKHMTENEKEIKKLKKKQRTMKKQETRDKYQMRIDALIEMERRDATI